MRAIGGEIVAEKRAVWRVLGVADEDRLEVLGEAHVEHLVGLVEDDDLDLVEGDAARVEVIDRAAGRRDDDVDAAGKAAELLPDRLAAVHRQDADRDRLAVAVDACDSEENDTACRGARHRPRISTRTISSSTSAATPAPPRTSSPISGARSGSSTPSPASSSAIDFKIGRSRSARFARPCRSPKHQARSARGGSRRFTSRSTSSAAAPISAIAPAHAAPLANTAPAKENEETESPYDAAAAPTAPADPDAKNVTDLFESLKNQSVLTRIARYEAFLRAHPESRFSTVVFEETSALKRLFSPTQQQSMPQAQLAPPPPRLVTGPAP